ncbi:2-hydroxychromene-2-carboxylate isomerase [Tistrella mobilis]|uniref:2-hydroxychromene-2-carboxylate isomerase n=1 Tax=Tistrella mobilis TaxID=171437 RepID=UPI00355852BA
MTRIVDCYLPLMSPWAYLGHDRFVAIADRGRAVIRWHPVDFAKIFAASGGVPVKQRPVQRQTYRMYELKRWRDRLGVPLELEPRFFPVDDTRAAHLVLQAMAEGADPAGLIGGVLGAVWAEGRDITDTETLADLLRREGLDAGLLDRADAATAELARRRAALTENAIEAGVFGAPTYIFDGEPFWGQDRLDFLAERLGVTLD